MTFSGAALRAASNFGIRRLFIDPASRGATDEPDKAQELLSRAKAETHGALGRARPFTEKVQKGRETLWRARFAGLEEDSAEAACRTLKRAGFSCFATKN